MHGFPDHREAGFVSGRIERKRAELSEEATDEALPSADDHWPWPFSRADLAAGLRRFFADPTIWIQRADPLTIAHLRPSIGRLRGAVIHYQGEQQSGTCRLIVKEPRGTTRTGLAGAGRREVGVYRYLASEFPLRSPRLIAASQAGDWMVLEEVRPHRRASDWSEADYAQSIRALTDLHDRFWGLAEDLSAFPWLSRPLDSDFEVHVAAASNSLEQIVDRGRLASWPERVHIMAHLILHADRVIEPLKTQPATLLHGDYWPGNISITEDGSQVVYDWQMAAVGPAILDLVAFALKSAWWFAELPVSQQQIVQQYRELLGQTSGFTWDDVYWEELWDHALMWRFIQEWMDLLAASPITLLETRSEQLERMWFEPLSRAVARRLL